MVQSIKNLIAAALIAISGFLFWTRVLPVYQYTANLKPQIELKLGELESKTALLKKVQDLNAEYNNRYTELQRLALIIPDKKGLPEIISMNEAMFSQTGNTLGQYLIGEDTTRDSALRKINLDISGKGTYESIVTLLETVERNIRLFDINAIAISEDEDAEGGQLDYQIKGSVYWLDPTVTAPAPARTTGGTDAAE